MLVDGAAIVRLAVLRDDGVVHDGEGDVIDQVVRDMLYQEKHQ